MTIGWNDGLRCAQVVQYGRKRDNCSDRYISSIRVDVVSVVLVGLDTNLP